jgi:hypothetical protein
VGRRQYALHGSSTYRPVAMHHSCAEALHASWTQDIPLCCSTSSRCKRCMQHAAWKQCRLNTLHGRSTLRSAAVHHRRCPEKQYIGPAAVHPSGAGARCMGAVHSTARKHIVPVEQKLRTVALHDILCVMQHTAPCHTTSRHQQRHRATRTSAVLHLRCGGTRCCTCRHPEL